MVRQLTRFALASACLLVLASSSSAQLTDFETFQVIVNPGLSIQAPTNLISQVHDETNNDQIFPTQVWLATCNNPAGASVLFSTDQAFTHTVDNSYKRDAALTLSLASGAAWSVTTPNAATNYAGGAAAEIVTLAAESNAPGNASFNVDVTFLEETFGDLAAGDYEMTVTGTITAK